MLLAVEGGGFFSSSASGYSKGLTLLFLGQKNEEKPMRVSPWNQYQLVDQASDPVIQLASTKDQVVCGCASFVCFGRTAAGLENPSPLKVGPTCKQDVPPGPLVSDEGKDCIHVIDVVDDDNTEKTIALRSSLRKPTNSILASKEASDKHVSSCEMANVPGHAEQRRVQWTDASGAELAEIREFELSEVDGSDDEFDNVNEKTCSCRIM